MPILIRRIAEGDAGLLADFYNGLSTPSKRTFRPLGETTAPCKCEEIIRDNAAVPEVKCDIVACDDGLIVGWSFLWNLASDAPTLGLAVADAYHGRRLGARLMEAALDAAQERGIRKVALTVVQDNEKACGMYERRGFVKKNAFTGEDGLPYFGMIRERERTTLDGNTEQ